MENYTWLSGVCVVQCMAACWLYGCRQEQHTRQLSVRAVQAEANRPASCHSSSDSEEGTWAEWVLLDDFCLTLVFSCCLFRGIVHTNRIFYACLSMLSCCWRCCCGLLALLYYHTPHSSSYLVRMASVIFAHYVEMCLCTYTDIWLLNGELLWFCLHISMYCAIWVMGYVYGHSKMMVYCPCSDIDCTLGYAPCRPEAVSLIMSLPHLLLYLLVSFPFFLFYSCFIYLLAFHPFPFYQNSPTPFPYSDVIGGD